MNPAILIKREEQPDKSNNSDGSTLSYLYNLFHQHYIILIILVLTGLIIFYYRFKIIAYHDRWRTRRRIQQGYYSNLNIGDEISEDEIDSEFNLDNESFTNDIEQGLNSSNFDVANTNLEDGRKGLSPRGKRYIKKLMEMDKNLTFDDARLIFLQNELNKNNIGNDGLPNDPRLVTF
ncbi:hypothetical protein KGF54_005537 [Candida jiufengensis]|uniref:uncharacterized protein n=1 Tax=Candida jiufengensis TaxID=497108 RepID=UPI00222446F4|nr:uncharacterized protein KGF54_005537 [Candida jiufengensis]KAI5949302.1 hypothetical protein KGF54_005537 [Candida jiufengensis]